MKITWFKAFKWFSVIMFILCVICGSGLIIWAGIAPDIHEEIEVEKGSQMAVIGLLFLFISLAIINNMRVFTLQRRLKYLTLSEKSRITREMNELTSLDYDKIKAQLQAGDWDKIEIVTGERGKGMSTLAIQPERRTMLERLKGQVINSLRWYDQNSPQFVMVVNIILAPASLFLGLVLFGSDMAILATLFITSSCVLFIVLGAAMMMYAHGGNDHDKPDS